jgi:hypothetical protein
VRGIVHPADLPRRGIAVLPLKDPVLVEAAVLPMPVPPTDATEPMEPPDRATPGVVATPPFTAEHADFADDADAGDAVASLVVAETAVSPTNEIEIAPESTAPDKEAPADGPRLEVRGVATELANDVALGGGEDAAASEPREPAVDPLTVSPAVPRLEPFEPFAVDDATSTDTAVLPTAFDLPAPPALEPVPADEELLLPPFGGEPAFVVAAPGCPCEPGHVQPIFGEICLGEADRCWCGECSPWKKLFAFDVHETNCDLGIGRQRLAFAPFEIEAAQPGNNLTLRYDAAYGMDRPDRSEFFWRKQAGTPGVPERELDYQHFWIVHEIGGGRFSMTTELPFRFLDPVVNENTAGLSDIRLAPKIVLVDGRDWQFSHVFRTYIPSGSPRKGLGTGHASIEPGFLLRYKWTEDTWLHGQLKAWFPLGGDPDFQGPTIIYGFGWGTNLCDTDTFAILGTLEFTGVSYLDGQSTGPTGILQFTDAETSLNVQPGARFVMGPAGDLGLFELGLSTGHALSIKGQYENQLRLDLRWSY